MTSSPDSVEAMVAKLLTVESDPIGCGLANNWHRNPDGLDAADMLTSQAQTIAALRSALGEMLRLADMDFEESLREPEENGNYAAYNRARAALSQQENG